MKVFVALCLLLAVAAALPVEEPANEQQAVEDNKGEESANQEQARDKRHLWGIWPYAKSYSYWPSLSHSTIVHSPVVHIPSVKYVIPSWSPWYHHSWWL